MDMNQSERWGLFWDFYSGTKLPRSLRSFAELWQHTTIFIYNRSDVWSKCLGILDENEKSPFF